MNKVLVSYYNEKSSPNKTVAMLGSRVCPECHGKNLTSIGCKRCNEDSYLTNQIPFNSQLMECAIAESFMEGQGWKLGDVICVNETSDKNKCFGDKSVIVRITDLMKDHNCKCGHTKDAHSMSGEVYEGVDLCGACGCEHYQQRCIDLTESAFEKLAPLSVGLIECDVEVLK